MAKIATIAALRTLYDQPMERAAKKDIGRIDQHIRTFIAHSPFCVVSSTGANGRCDASPRGDAAGFVHVLDDRTLLIPDRPGNNRLDTLTNIIERPEVGLLFLVPGAREQLRVNGTAELRDDPELLRLFEVRGKLPKLVIRVAVHEAYLHCGKAVIRSDLWNSALHVKREALPSIGQVIQAQTGLGAGETHAEMDARYEKTLY